MTFPHGGANNIWREGEGPHRPTKSQIRDYLGYFQNLEARRFETIGQLIADGDLSYNATEEADAVIAHQGLSAQGAQYKIAESTATDHHLATAGGVKLYVEPLAVAGYAVDAFGAIGDGVADDTAAIQATINAAATDRVIRVTFSAKHYKFTNLYLHYDAINNPGYPSDPLQQGRISLVGQGSVAHSNPLYNSQVGTVLESTDPIGPAISGDGDPLNEGTNRTDKVKMRDMSVWVNNSTWAFKYYRVVQGSGFEDIAIKQTGSGGGIEWTSSWFGYARNVQIRGGGKAVSGTGFVLKGDSSGLSGGGFEFQTLVVNDFNTGWELGDTTFAAGSRLHSLNCTGSQAGGCGTGIKVGHGINQFNWINSHIETCDVGMVVGNGATELWVQGSSFVNTTRCFLLGDGLNVDSNRWGSVYIGYCQFISNPTTTNHIEVFSSSSTDGGLEMQMNHHVGSADATDVAIWIEDVFHAPISLDIAAFTADLTTEIVNGHRIQTDRSIELQVHRANNKGSSLAEPPFQFRAESTTGTQAPIGAYQRDTDAPFLQFETVITPTANANHISTTNSGAVTGPGDGAWVFSRMVKVQTNDATGVSDYWMPLFTMV